MHGMAGHESTRNQTDHWLTPPDIIKSLGEFDLDPCYSRPRPWVTAKTMWGLPEQDGLKLPWFGRVWLNPPYGSATRHWLHKMALHGNGIALIHARTETKAWFESIWPEADAILFMRKRLTFHTGDGTKAENTTGAPTALVAYGPMNVHMLWLSRVPGCLVTL